MTLHEGYVWIRQPDHHRASTNGYVFEHVLIVERAMGRLLRRTADIHHVNRIRSDNRNCNLVVCHNGAYHRLLHQRQRALDACGHADWRKCQFCKGWDDPKKLYVNGGTSYHIDCRRTRMAEINAPKPRPTKEQQRARKRAYMRQYVRVHRERLNEQAAARLATRRDHVNELHRLSWAWRQAKKRGTP